MPIISSNHIDAIKQVLMSPQKVIILSHYNPDGDSLGSSLGLQRYLQQNGHLVHNIYPSKYPPYYQWMPQLDQAIIFNPNLKDRLTKIFEEASLIICLDFNSTNRINDLEPFLIGSKAKRIMIDHHQHPEDAFDIACSYPSASSTCELIFDLIVSLSGTDAIDESIAAALYTGLITDTGGFQFSSTHPSSHMMAATLYTKSIQPQEIFNHCFNNFSLNRLKLFGHCIANNMKIVENKKLAYIWIDHETKNMFNIQEGDTEGLVNYPLKVSNIEIAVLFKEDTDRIRISFRSKNKVDVSEFSRTHFSGGGHINAAGGSSKLSLSDTLTHFEELIQTSF
jgi:phosphoesterase RecJ-like protein